MKPIRVTKNFGVNDQLLYFTSSSLTEDGKHLVFISDRTGDPNLFVKNLITGEERQLTDNQAGYLKSYVYFKGNTNQGFGKASVSLDEKQGNVYYLQGRKICRVDLEGNREVLAEYPEDQVTAFTHVSRDGSRLCVPTTDTEAFNVDKLGEEKPNYRIDQRIQEENLNSYLHIYDTETGEEIDCEVVPQAWITHVQFSPQDKELILYNHEWPHDCGIRRMWLWDGEKHRRLRREEPGYSREDWVCHEMWQSDGTGIIYHGGYENGPMFIGRVELDGFKLTEIPINETYQKYGHFTASNTDNNLLVSDGYFQKGPAEEPKTDNGAWISLQRINWKEGKIDWVPLCQHGSNWESQDSHPHPICGPNDNYVYFNSNQDGSRAIYKVKLEE